MRQKGRPPGKLSDAEIARVTSAQRLFRAYQAQQRVAKAELASNSAGLRRYHDTLKREVKHTTRVSHGRTDLDVASLILELDLPSASIEVRHAAYRATLDFIDKVCGGMNDPIDGSATDADEVRKILDLTVH